MAEPSAETRRTRILFVAEAVTLAHVARPVVLASTLDRDSFEVHLAHHPRFRALLGDLDITEHEINSISPAQFMDALAKGQPVYDLATLSSYVEEDLRLLVGLRPDIVVGDFRLSLAVSSARAGVPYVALSNAYWSPYCKQSYTVPDLPMTRMLGTTLAQLAFNIARPVAFALHCRPMNRLRRKYALGSLGWDLRSVYTHADYTLYADAEELYRMESLPPNHRFLGPVVWSPECPLPAWWQDLPSSGPVIYVTPGSSGHASLLPLLVEALGQLELTAMVSTAGAEFYGECPANVFLADYLPGEAAVKRSSLVICNGGSPTTHQALVNGVPVLGLAGNLDQYLNMASCVNAGAGCVLRSATAGTKQLHGTISKILADSSYKEAAVALSRLFDNYDISTEFHRIINEIVLESRAVS